MRTIKMTYTSSSIALTITVGLLLAVLVFLSWHNVTLRREISRAEEPHYIFDGAVLAEMARAQSQGERVVLNRVDELAGRTVDLSLEADLVIDESTCGVHGIFDRVGDIQVDREGDIYVSEVRLGVVKKFDSRGRYLLTIGRQGSGPGELQLPDLLRIDGGTLHVLDMGNRRISMFTRNGRFVGSFQIDIRRTVGGMALGPDGQTYISGYDPKSGYVIHVFDREGHRVASFGEAVVFRQPVTPEDEAVKSNISCGPILLRSDSLWYCQSNPFELRLYRRLGDRWKVLLRSFIEGDLLPPCTLSYQPGGVVSFRLPAGARFMGMWSNRLVVDLCFPQAEAPEPSHRLVFADLGGRLTGICDVRGDVALKCIDNQGRFYARVIFEDGTPAIVRYKVSVSPR